MTKYTKHLLVTAALIGISASVPATAATGFYEVVVQNSRAVKAREHSPNFTSSICQETRDRNSAEIHTAISATAATSFQEVVEQNSAALRGLETVENKVAQSPVSTSSTC